jgi:hypothetical protein
VQQIGDLGRGVTDDGDVRGHGDGVPAHEVLSAAILQPSCEPAAPGRRPRRSGVTHLFDERRLGLCRGPRRRGYGVFFSAAAAV